MGELRLFTWGVGQYGRLGLGDEEDQVNSAFARSCTPESSSAPQARPNYPSSKFKFDHSCASAPALPSHVISVGLRARAFIRVLCPRIRVLMRVPFRKSVNDAQTRVCRRRHVCRRACSRACRHTFTIYAWFSRHSGSCVRAGHASRHALGHFEGASGARHVYGHAYRHSQACLAASSATLRIRMSARMSMHTSTYMSMHMSTYMLHTCICAFVRKADRCRCCHGHAHISIPTD